MLSSQSNLPSPYEFPESDKVVHVLVYAPLGFLMVYALSRSTSSANLIFFGAFLAFLYGLTDEIHQVFVPGRDASALDVMADGTGAMIGNFIFYLCALCVLCGEYLFTGNPEEAFIPSCGSVNPVPRTCLRGFGALPFGELQNIHPRTHVRSVLWYGVKKYADELPN